MKRLYLCGAITNNPDYKNDFKVAEEKLYKTGYPEVLNPVKFCADKNSWQDCMRKCVQVLLAQAHLGIAKIETPYPSKGQALELHIAEAFDLEVKTVDEWAALAKQEKQNKE